MGFVGVPGRMGVCPHQYDICLCMCIRRLYCFKASSFVVRSRSIISSYSGDTICRDAIGNRLPVDDLSRNISFCKNVSGELFESRLFEHTTV